jgi:diguanylate cyclase (GGDEF)-like protein/PAS domain S-box-containing protein
MTLLVLLPGSLFGYLSGLFHVAQGSEPLFAWFLLTVFLSLCVFFVGFFIRVARRLSNLELRASALSGKGTISRKLLAGDEIDSLEASFERMVKALQARKEEMSRLLDLLNLSQNIAKVGSWLLDPETRRMWWSLEMFRLCGFDVNEEKPTLDSFLEVVHPDDRAKVTAWLDSAIMSRTANTFEHRLVMKDGRVRWVREMCRFDDMQGLVGTCADITDDKAMIEHSMFLKEALDCANDIIFVIDRHGFFRFVNRRFTEVYNYEEKDVVGMPLSALKVGGAKDALYEEMWTTVNSRKTWVGTLKFSRKYKDEITVRTQISPILSIYREVMGFLGVQRVSEEDAWKGDFTVVQDRTSLLRRVEFFVATAPEHDKGALLLIDLDDFNIVNQVMGPLDADRFLRLLDQKLRNACEVLKADMGLVEISLARFHGDEFGCFVPNAGKEEAMKIGEALRKTISETPFYPGQALGASIGVSLFPEHGVSASVLLRCADLALGWAKNQDRNKVHCFEVKLAGLVTGHAMLEKKALVEEALRKKRIVPYFQPILDLRRMQVTHFEALARLVTEDGKVLGPADFLEVATHFGLFAEVDKAIFEQVAFVAKGCMDDGKRFSFAVNINPRELREEEWAKFVLDVCESLRLPLDCFIFEITETELLTDLDRARELLTFIRANGGKTSLDDFGMGYSSFVYLKSLPVDIVKIDGSFIRRIHQEPGDETIVRSMLMAAKGFGLHTVAEFVENRAILDKLVAIGVDFAQGYYVGVPSPDLVEDIGHILIKESPRK